MPSCVPRRHRLPGTKGIRAPHGCRDEDRKNGLSSRSGRSPSRAGFNRHVATRPRDRRRRAALLDSAAACRRTDHDASADSVSPGTPASAPRSARPATPVRSTAGNGSTDCAELQRRYLASQACFAPYRLANGGLGADAFRHCTVVQDPSPRCGLPHLQQP
jgi:hypothetical protein